MPCRHTVSPAQRLVAGCLIFTQFFWFPQGRAANFYWDSDENVLNNALPNAGLGGTGSWDLSTLNWWNGVSPTEDMAWPNDGTAIFAGVPGTVTLASGIAANQLSFLGSGYTLTGGNLTLAGTTPALHANFGEFATINSPIEGADGLVKTGGGTIRLGNAGNTYTGVTAINNGILVINDEGALGSDASAIMVNGSATRGFGGGVLLLEGGYDTGVNLTRGLALQGLGAINANGVAFVSVGSNTISGPLTNGTAAVNTALASVGGRLNVGDVTIGGATGSIFMTFGAGGGAGVGSYAINGVLSGSGSIQKIGGGTLILAPSDASGFTGTLRVTAGSVRIDSPDSLGRNAGAGAAAPLDLAGDGAILELRMDDPLIGRNIYNRAGGSPIIFVDHAIDSHVLNGTATFGNLAYDDGESVTLNGRNGYGVAIGAAPVITGNGNTTFSNNLSGQLGFYGAFWSNADNGGSRTMTIGGTGDTLISGDIIASAADFDHNLTKTGAGTLTVTGTASTLDGAVTISAGTVAITDFRSITNNASVVNLGATSANGTLAIGTAASATSAGLVTEKVINLAGTTGGGTINANQAGTNPVIFTSGFTATGAGSKALTLGGSSNSSVENEIRGAIVNNSATNMTSVVKSGPNTWMLAGANTYTGATLVNDGTLKVQDTFAGTSTNVLADSALVGLGFALAPVTVGTAGGTFHYAGAVGASSVETVGTLLPGAGAGTIRVTAGEGGSASLNFASLDAAPPVALTAAVGTTSTTTLTVASTAGLVPGMRVQGAVGSATYIVSITNGTQFVVSASQTNLPTGTNLTFSRLNGGGTINFDPAAGSNVTMGTVPAEGLLSSYTYFKGADFAYAPTTTNAILRAPVYDVDPSFVTAGAGLVPNSHNLVSGNATTGAATVLSLKIAGSQTVEQTGLLTVRSGAAGTSGGILVTGGAATISGTGITTGGAADLIIRVDGASDVLTLTAPVTAITTGGLTKTGAGTLIIGGLNAQTTGGSTNLHEGTIQLIPGGRLSANTVNLNMRQGTVLDLNGVSVAQTATTSSIGIFNGTGTVTNTSSDPVVFAVAGSGGTFNGTIHEGNGRISFVKMGTSSSQTLNGFSNYTGSTTIGVPGTGTTGSLVVSRLANIGFDSSIGRGDATDASTNAGSLIFGGTTGGLIYTGTSSVSTDRLFTLAGTAATAGATITNNAVNNQALVFSNTNPIAFAAPNPQLLQLAGNSTSDNWFYPQITDSGTDANVTKLTKTGTGLWVLGNSNNSYTGMTSLANGILRLGAPGSLPAASPLVIGVTTTSGTLETSGEFTRPLAATAVTGAGTVTWGGTTGGGGFAAASSKLVVAIGGTATPTALTWGQGGFVGTGGTQSLILNSVTALSEVEFRNAIDLNGAVRTIIVNENVSTFTDYATITGVISNGAGTGGISKTGNGTLQLFGANTYNGTTAVTAGTLVVNSLGNSSDPATGSSVGTNIGANTAAQAITLGNGGSGAAILQYVGPGETSDRMIRINTTTGTTQIHADGSGPLILTNVLNDMAAGNKSLVLRGSNTMGNMITSVLANNAAGTNTLAIVADGGATWILAGDNTYTGNTTISAGALGAGHDHAFGTSTLLLRNGSLFAYGGDRTIANAMTVASTTSGGTFTFIGDHDLTLTGDWNYTNTTAGHVITNGMTPGSTLTLDGDMVLNALAGNITLSINGIGGTVLNGDITTTTAFNVGLSYTGNGTLTISGNNPTAGATALNNAAGTLRVVDAGKLGTGALTVNSGSLFIESVDHSVTTLTMGNVANTSALLDVAAGLTLSPTAITFSGTTTLPANITGAGTLALGSAGITVTVADNITQTADMLWTIDNLTGSGLFTKAGTGTLDLTGITNNDFTGGYQIDAGAILGLGVLANNIALNGGVYAGSGSFTRSLGLGDNQIQWLALGGGFAAVGGDLSVTLGGAPDPLVWAATSHFLPDGAPLILGSTAADGVTTFTHNIDLGGAARTVTVVDNTANADDQGVLTGILSNGGITKTGNGILRLSGANTFTGGVTVTTGTVQFSTVSDNGGGPSNLGQGVDGLSLGGGTLSFVGDAASQSTNRAINTTASSTLSANGTNGAVITYSGGITQTANSTLTLSGTGEGRITGGIDQVGATSSDLVVASGVWTIRDNNVTVGDDLLVNGGTLTLENMVFGLNDDIVVTGAGTVLNLNSTGVWAPTNPAGTSSGLFARGGAVININADDVNGIANANLVEYILLGDSTTAGTGTLNLNTFDITLPRLDLGAVASGLHGEIVGSGTITATYAGTDYGQGFRFFSGSVAADLAGVSTILKQGLGDVTLSGDNSGLTGTVGVTRLDAGRLILDYSTDNSIKISADAGLDMRGVTLELNGGVLANTVQSVTALTVASGGANQISLTSGAFSTTLNLGAITRANSAGTLRLNLPATGAITTTTANHSETGLLGTTGTAFATVTDATGTFFAINDGAGNIVPLTYAAANNNPATWQSGDHITEDAGGFTGTLNDSLSINSLRFNAAGGSEVALAPDAVLTIASGGILRTDAVTGGPSKISGGRIFSSSGELVFTVDGTVQPLNVSSVIGGVNALTKTGDGILHLSGENYYTGTTQIHNGTLRVSGGNAIGDRAAVVLADDHSSILEVMDDETIGALSGGSATSGLDALAFVNLGANTLTVNQNATGTFSGQLTGSGSLIKTGASTLALGGASPNFTGDLIVNQGQLTLATRTISNLINVGSVTVNSATLLLDFNSGSETSNKINNLAPVTLINTGGLDGLRANNDRNDGSKNEVVGVMTLLGGANTVTVSASSTSGTTQRNVTITAASIMRSNQSTLLVRGQNLGTTLTGAPLSPIHTGRFVNTALPALIGGGGVVGTDHISIVPWAVGSNSITGTGDSFVTAAATTGYRPLNLDTEYEQLAVGGGLTATNNVRYSNFASLTLDATAKTMNSLLVDNASGVDAISLTGAGTTLEVNSGAFLFTGTEGITLDGFSGITTGATGLAREYIFHVSNSAAAGVTVGSPLTTAAASLTKSGSGTLILTGLGSTYSGQTAINQGVLQIDAMDKLGSNGSGGILINGGTLRFGGIFDPSTVPLTFGIASTATVQATAGGTLDTNGYDIALANSIGNGGNGGLTKTGNGILTLNAPATYTGTTTVSGGTLAYGVANALPATMNVTLAGGGVDLGGFAGTLNVLTLTGNGSLNLTSTLNVTGDLVNSGGSRTLTFTGGGTSTFNGPMVHLSDTTTSRTLTFAVNDGTVIVNSTILNGPAAASALAKTGVGTLQLTAANSYNGATTIGSSSLPGGTVRLTGAGTLSSGNLTVASGSLFIESVDQSVATLSMGGGAVDASSMIDIGAGLVLKPTAITFSATNNNLTAVIGGAGTLDLGTAGITVTVNNSTAVDIDMSWEMDTVIGSGVFTKLGTGTLDIRGVTNYNYNATAYEVNAGAILGLEELGVNLVLNGGVFEGNGTFTRSLGTGPNQVQWAAGTGGGGFSAAGGDLVVTLAGVPNPLVWGGTPFFVPDGAPLIFGSTTAENVVNFTHDINLNGAARAVSAIDNPAVTTDYAVLSGMLSNGGITKTGNGILRLGGANTFNGGVTVTTGTLQFETVSDNGGGPSNLGQGTDGISLGGGRLQFVGSVSQSTNRAMTFTNNSILDASGVGSAAITYNGAIAAGGFSLTLDGTGDGFLNGQVTTTGTAADLNKNGSGTWTINVAPVIVDNLVISGGTLIFNAADSFTGDDLFIRTATLKLNVNGALTKSMDDFNISTETAGGGVFDIAGTTGSAVTDIIIGANPANQATQLVLSGSMVDSVGGGSFSSTTLNVRNGSVSTDITTIGATTLGGTITAHDGGVNSSSGTISGNLNLNTGSSLTLYSGAITGNITFAAGITTTKHSSNTVTLSGNNTVAGAGITSVNNGILRLNHSVNTGPKISSAGLTMNGGSVEIEGHATTPVTVSVGNLTLGSSSDPAPAVVKIDTAGASTTLEVGTITRNAGSTLRFNPSSADAHFTTTAGNTAGSILGGWATFQLGAGPAQFATVSGAEIVGFNSTVMNDMGSWTSGAHVTDSTGFTGALAGSVSVGSLRFDAASGTSMVMINAGGILEVSSGGILITNNVASGYPTITGGRITAGTANELIVTHDGAAPFTLASRMNGSLALTKAGSGLMLLNQSSNTASGTLRVLGGTLQLQGTGAVGDFAPVILEPAIGVNLSVIDSETIGSLSGGSSTNYRNMVVTIADSKELTINQNTNLSYFGNISAASGAATLTKTGPGTLTITDGIIDVGVGGVINIDGGRLTLDINGNNNQLTQIAPGATINISNGGSLFVEHNGITISGSIAAGRIANDVNLVFNSGGSGTDSLLFRQDQDDDHIETIGNVTFGSGVNSIRIDATSTGASALTVVRATSVTRENQATLVLRGANIQKTANPRAQFQSTALFPGFGTGTTTSLPVIPWAVGLAAGGTTGAGDSFLTTAGTANAAWRPLNLATEYAIVTDATTWGATTATQNVLVSTTPTGAAGKTIRSLLIATGTGAVDLTGDGGGALTVDSGGFLFSGTGSSIISGFTGIGVNDSVSEYVFHVMGSSATIEPALTTPGAKITKSGPGTLILSANNTGVGAITINEGDLQIADLDNIGGDAGTIIFAGGTLSLAGTGYSGDDLSTRTFTLLIGGGTVDTNGNDIAFANAIGGGSIGGFTKAGEGVLTLNAAIAYQGGTTISGGTLRYGIPAALPVGMDVTLSGGTLDIGSFDSTLADLTVAANSTIAGSAPLVFTGDVVVNGGAARTLTVNNSGGTSFSGDTFYLVSTGTTARTTTFNGTGEITISSEIANGTAAGGVNYAGTGTLILSGPNTYTGTTTVSDGTLRIAADQVMPGGLAFGASGSAGALDLPSASAEFSTMTVLTNSGTLVNTVNIGAAESLTLTGNVTIGANAAASTTLFTAAGGGSFVINNDGGTFQLGGATGGTNVNAATADFSGLASFSADLGSTGTFRVGDNNSNSTGAVAANSVLILAATQSTITAGTVNIGQGAGQNSTPELRLGAGANVIHANTINIGGNTTRSGGALLFDGPTGSVVIRGADGTGRAALNMVNGSISTGVSHISNLFLAGHSADLLLGSLTMASRSANSGSVTSTLTFDEGTLDVTNWVMANRTGSGTGGASATATLGGGTVTIGALNMAINTSAGGTVIANFNITGGDVSIGTGSGIAINMANAGAGRTVNSSLNLTGGDINVAGAIVRAGGAGEDAAVSLAGAVLNMGGNTIGTAAAPIVFDAQSGVLTNLTELNDGGLLTKATLGVLTLGNGNAYTGGTLVSEGMLLVNNTIGSGTGTGSVTVDSGAVLGGSGSVAGLVTVAGVLAPGRLDGGGDSLVGRLTIDSIVVDTSATLQLQLGGATVLDPDNVRAFQNDPGSFVVPASWTSYEQGVTQHDQLFISKIGAPDLDGLTIQVLPDYLNGFNPTYGHVFQVIDWTSLGTLDATGTVDFSLPSLGEFAFDTRFWDSHGILVVVPEPGRMLLLLLGLFGLVFRRRRSVS